ncbi:MAG: carbonic anhydrase [Acidimicrobiia bacterium]
MDIPRSRREVLGSALRLSGGLVAASAVGATALADVAGAATVPRAPFPKTPQRALDRLLAGNRRFVAGDARDPRRSNVRRVQIASGQMPFAAVLTCADSRVPPELIFDEGFGDLFVVRIAGNTAADPLVIGSLEYAVAVSGSILVFVLGHSDCGAVKGAIDVATKGETLPGDIGAVVAPIIPAVEEVKAVPKAELFEAATEKNIERAVAQLSEVAILRDLVDSGKLMIAGGEYELESGQVDLVE